MAYNLLVQKFGGSSIKDIKHIQKCADIIEFYLKQSSKIIVVVSAMGSSTDQLIAMARNISASPPQRELDMLISTGERISASLLCMALFEKNISSLSLTGSQCGILTDSQHQNARISQINQKRLLASLESCDVVVVAGFQGVNPETKEITTLGRGGSDLTAIALASALNANKCQIFTDVKGVLSADPDICEHAVTRKKISHSHMYELAVKGACVIHHRAAFLAFKNSISYEVRCTFEPFVMGSFVSNFKENSMEKFYITSITYKKNQTKLRFNVLDQSSSYCPKIFYSEISEWLWKHDELPVHFQMQAERLLDNCYFDLICSLEIKDKLKAYLEKKFDLFQLRVIHEDLASISLIGSGFNHNPQCVAKLVNLVDSEIFYINYESSSFNICIDQKNLFETVNILHKNFCEDEPTNCI